jgi:hypothetical protein
VVLAGPHKTASSSLQEFFVNIAGSSVSVTNVTFHENETSTLLTPHPLITEWVWPVEIRDEYKYMMAGLDIAIPRRPRKFYSILASYVSGRRFQRFFKVKNRQLEDRVAGYFRSLLKRPWKEGKNLLIASEEFDAVVQSLLKQKPSVVGGDVDVDGAGETMHVAQDSSKMIDALLGMFPQRAQMAPLARRRSNWRTSRCTSITEPHGSAI